MTDKWPRAEDEPESYKYAKGLQKPIPKGWKDIVVGPPEKDARTFPEWKDDPRYQHCPFNYHNGLAFDLEHTTRECKKLTAEAKKKGEKPKPLTKEQCWANVFPRSSAGQVTFLEYFEHEGQVWDMVRKYVAVLQRDEGLRQAKPFPGKECAHILEGYYAVNRNDTRATPQWCGIGPSAWLFEAMEVKGDRHEPSTWLSHPFRSFARGGYHAFYAVPNGCAYPPVPESLVPGAICYKQHPTKDTSHYDTVIRHLGGGKYDGIGSNEGGRGVCGSVRSLTGGNGVSCVIHWWEPAIRYLRRKGKGGEKYVPKPIPCEKHSYVSSLIGNFSGMLVIGSEWSKCPKITKKMIADHLNKAEGNPDAPPPAALPKKEPTHGEIITKGKQLIWQDVTNAATWPEGGYNWAHGMVSKGKKEYGKELINGLIKHHQKEGGKEFKNHSEELIEEIRALCMDNLAEFEVKCWKGFGNPYLERKNPPPPPPSGGSGSSSSTAAQRPLTPTPPAASKAATHAEDSSALPKAGSIYQIEPRHAPNLRVDVAGAASSDGTKIHLWDKNGSKAQQFMVHSVDGGYYVFEPLCALGKAVDNAGKAKKPCHLWDSLSNCNQDSHWALESTGDGYFAVISRTQGGHRWDVEGAKKSKGGKLFTWTNDGGNQHRQFKFTLQSPAASSPTAKAAPGWTCAVCTLDNEPHTTVCAACESKKGNSSGVVPPSATMPVPTPPTALSPLKVGDIYEIEPCHAPGMRIDVVSAGNKNGTKLHQWSCNGSNAQRFKVHQTDGGYYVFEPLCAPGKAIDNGGGSKIQCHVWDMLDFKNQNTHFKVELTDGYVNSFSVVARTHGGHYWDVVKASKDAPSDASKEEGARLMTRSNDKGSTPAHRRFRFISSNNPSSPPHHLPPVSPPPQKQQAPVVASPTAGSSTSTAGPLKAGCVYEISPRHAPDLRVDVCGAKNENGTKIHTWDYRGGASQKFKVHQADGGWYVFEPFCAPGSAIDNRGTSKKPCHLWEFGGGGLKNHNAHWKLDPNDEGFFAVVSRTNGCHCWDVEAGKKERGGKLYTWVFEGAQRQLFKFIDVSGGQAVPDVAVLQGLAKKKTPKPTPSPNPESEPGSPKTGPIDTNTQLYGPSGTVHSKSFFSETITKYALREKHHSDDVLRVLQCNHGFDLEIVELSQSNHKESSTLTLNTKDTGELILSTMVQDAKTQKEGRRSAYRLEAKGAFTPLCLCKNGLVTFGEHTLIPPARAASPTPADGKTADGQPGSIITYLVFVLDCVGIMYRDANTGGITWAGALGVSQYKNERLMPSEKVVDQAKTKLAALIAEDRVPIISNLSGSGANSDRRSNLVRYSKFSAVSADGKGSAVSWDGKTLSRSSNGTPCNTEGCHDGSVLQLKHGDLFLTDVKHRESVRQKLWPPYHALIGWDQCPLYQLAFHKGNVVYLDHRGEELARNWTRGHMFAGVLDARKSDKHREKYNVITVVLIGGASGGLLGCCDLYRSMSKLGHDHPHLEVTRHDVLKVGPQGWMTGATSVLRDLEEWGMIPTYTGDKSKCSGVGRRFVLFGISMGGGVIPQVGQEIVNRCGPDALLAQVHQCGQSAGTSLIKALPQSVSIYLYHGDSDTTVSWAKTGTTVHGYATKNPKRRVVTEILPGVNHDLGTWDKVKYKWCWELMWSKLILEWLTYEMRRPVPKGFCGDNAIMPSQKGALFPEKHPAL